jgi:hypothetical protein
MARSPPSQKKGYLVQVPYRTLYKMETVGTEPSLRCEVNIAKATSQYPSDEKPPDVPGYEFLKTAVGGQGRAGQGQPQANHQTPGPGGCRVLHGALRGLSG